MTPLPLSSIFQLTSTLLTVLLLTAPSQSLAHKGHGDNEFQGKNSATQVAGAISVDAKTAQLMGLKVELVTRQRLAFGLNTTGQIEPLPNQQVEVTTPVKGTVTRLLVSPGDRVKAGQAVATMTSPELAELRATALDRRSEAIASVQQAQADLQLAQQNYAQQQKIAATELAQVRSEVSFAQERFDKDQELLASGAIARRTFLESETKLAQAEAALTKAESRLSVSEATSQLRHAESAVQVAQSRVNLSDETYQTRLRQLGANANGNGTITITAPIAGTVADLETTTGESGEDAGKKVMTIINDSSVQVSANIYEKDLDRIQMGQRVQVKVASLTDRTFTGRISVIGAAVQGETRVVPVKAELENSAGLLKPGMFAELEVLTERTAAAVLAIPKSALVETSDKKQIVFAQNGDAFQPTEVTLGQASGELIEIKNGLFDGDRIVTQRAMQLYAQSLRSGSNTAEDHEHGEKAAAPTLQPSTFPWWLVIPAGGAIAAGTFGAGVYWANRRYRQGFRTPQDYGLQDIQEQDTTRVSITSQASESERSLR
jgi:membrane fusion protein, heavy metal efflux system